MGEEVVVGGQVLAGQLDGLEVQDLSGSGSTLHLEMVSSACSFLYFSLIFKVVTSRLP